MAVYRKVQTTFWTDPFIESLDKDHRYFYLFLMTNPLTNQLGIYEISIGYMCRTCSFTEDKVRNLLQFFVDKGKIKYHELTQEIALKNWAKHNYSDSWTVQACMNGEHAKIKNKELFNWVYKIVCDHPKPPANAKKNISLYVPNDAEYMDTSAPGNPPLNPAAAPKEPAKTKSFIPPTIEEVEQYFTDNGYPKEKGTQAYKYYHTGQWKNRDGKPVLNWKQTMQGVWMKDPPQTSPERTNSPKSLNDLTPDEKARLSQQKADEQRRYGSYGLWQDPTTSSGT